MYATCSVDRTGVAECYNGKGDLNVLRFAFWKARNYAPARRGYSATDEDLDEFAKRFELELS